MSHLKERKEKICLNCDAAIHGRFCHVCGQENIEPKESFWHLATHFVFDLIHFDGKFFSTLKYLLFKPGHLPTQYLKGKRANYLHPIRLYVFVSAFFFLIIFSFYTDKEKTPEKIDTAIAKAVVDELQQTKKKQVKILQKLDSSDILFKQHLDTIALIDSDIALLTKDNKALDKLKFYKETTSIDLGEEGTEKYSSLAAYDAAQANLPVGKRDNFLEKLFRRQGIKYKEHNGKNAGSYTSIVMEKLYHLFPQLLFVSLPLFAILLKLFYIRRKSYYYVNHVIFSIYLYCFIFINILLSHWIDSLLSLSHITEFKIGKLILTLLSLVYIYKAFRTFYLQSGIKTIGKMVLLIFPVLILFTFLSFLFLIISALLI